MTHNSHTKRLVDAALDTCLQFNWEEAGLTHPDRLKNYFVRLANRCLKKRGFIVRDRAYTQRAQEKMLSFLWARPMLLATHTMLLNAPTEFDKTYKLLCDDESRRTFDWYVQHRFASAYLHGLADSIFPAPISRDLFMETKAKQKIIAQQTGLPLLNLTMLALGQYSLQEHGIYAEEGDVVIDAGGGVGDTVWMFRKHVKNSGRILVFEPIPAQRKVIAKKCQDLRWTNVAIYPYALWNKKGTANISMCAGRSSLHPTKTENETQPTKTITLDNFVEEHGIDKIDFIKMDIEGAEQNALLGCRKVIEQHTPKLAISIYHLADDMLRIPQILSQMPVEYRFYLRHYTHFFGDTILYAKPISKKKSSKEQ